MIFLKTWALFPRMSAKHFTVLGSELHLIYMYTYIYRF